MATRLKTVHYAFATLANLTNNTLTNLAQRTIFLPETGTKTFRSVVAHVTFDDIITVTGGTLTTKTLNFRLGAAGYTSVANANSLINSGENASFHLIADYTSHFTSNWTGSSMTCDFQLQINQGTGTTLNMVNVSVTLEITYEYDDASATQIKSVMIPLNAPTGSLASAATTVDTFPALDTYLPESGKSYRDIFVVVQGNDSLDAATTDSTLTISVGSTTVTTGNRESALLSSRWFRYVFDILEAGFSGSGASQNFQLWALIASRFYHLQAYAVVTYEYNESATTSVMNSVFLPMDMGSPMGGTTSADYQSAARYLDIEEPGTITTSRLAFFPHWQQAGAISGLNMRIGGGSFVSYTDSASTVCGGVGAMLRNDASYALTRGRNTLRFDAYRTDSQDWGTNVSGFWLVNYTSSKASAGTGAHNHTVFWGLLANGTGGAASNFTAAASSFSIPETEFYIVAAGSRLIVQSNGASTPSAYVVRVERLAVEGGLKWETSYLDYASSDNEVGVYFCYSQMRDVFRRWANDADTGRLDIETGRRWQVYLGSQSIAVSGWCGLSTVITYHSILSEVDGAITGSSGGIVSLNLHDAATGEVLKTASRTGNGPYSIPFYGDTRQVYVTARESGTLLGRSDTGTPVLV
jgi:hypothetical protein